MADIFISYAHENRGAAHELASEIEALGLSVWWDRSLLAGGDFYAAIESEIASARRVIVLWSKESVASGWVRSEADEAAQHDKLLPIRLDDSKIPMGFRHLHTVDAGEAKGNLRGILKSLGLLAATPVIAPVAAPATPGAADPPCLECDLLAADPLDPGHVGEGVEWIELDAVRAIPACRAAIQQYPGVERFEYQLGRALLKNEDVAGAIPWLKAAASKNHREALSFLGYLYSNGGLGLSTHDVPVDPVRGMQYWRQAAALGCVQSMCGIGYALQEGTIVAQDYAQARSWYEKAFAAGNGASAALIGDLHANGFGTQADSDQALHWYRLAASAGSDLHYQRFGPAFEGGFGLPVDKNFAIALLKISAESGSTCAMDELARRTGDEAWYRRAMAALQALAARHDPAAIRDIGSRYRFGTGVAQDRSEARILYARAAEAGDALAAEFLAQMLLSALEGTHDPVRAIPYLEQASRNGRPDCYLRLARLYDSGTGVAQDPALAADYLFRGLELDGLMTKSEFLEGFSQTWYEDHDEMEWSDELKELVLTELNKRGYYAGPIDSDFGPKAIDGVRRLLRDKQLDDS